MLVYVVVLTVNGRPEQVYGPYDADEAGALAAAALAKGATLGSLHVLPLTQQRARVTFRVAANEGAPASLEVLAREARALGDRLSDAGARDECIIAHDLARRLAR